MKNFKVGDKVLDRDSGIQGVITRVVDDDIVDVSYGSGAAPFSSEETCIGAKEILCHATPAAIKRYDKRIAVSTKQRKELRGIVVTLQAQVARLEKLAKLLGRKAGEECDDNARTVHNITCGLVESYKL